MSPKFLSTLLLGFSLALARAQGPITYYGQIMGTFTGVTKFNTDHPVLGKPLDSSVKVTTAVKGHYIQFQTVLYIPNAPEETLSLLTFDPIAGLFEMWTFNQHSPGARMLTGTLDKDKGLVLTTPGMEVAGHNIAYREIIHVDSPNKFTVEFDVRRENKWAEDYTSTFTRKE